MTSVVFDHLRVSRSNTIGFVSVCLITNINVCIWVHLGLFREIEWFTKKTNQSNLHLEQSDLNLEPQILIWDPTVDIIRILEFEPFFHINHIPVPLQTQIQDLIRIKMNWKLKLPRWVIEKLSTVPLKIFRRKPIQQNAMSTLHSIRIKSNQFDPFWIMTNHIRRNYEMIVSNQLIRIV